MSPRIRTLVEGRGKPVTLIHGVGANLESWDAIAERLAADHLVIRMDLRGHGKSEHITGDCSIHDFVDDVAFAMDEAKVEVSDLVGFSLGGIIAQQMALTHPKRLRRVALISAVAARTPDEKKRMSARADKIAVEGVGSVSDIAVDRWFTDEFRQKYPERVEKRMRELVANHPQSYAKAYRVFAESDLSEELRGITHETLVATGEFDSGSSPRMSEYMHDIIPNSELQILKGLKHSVLIEAPDRIYRMIKDFLDR